MSNDSQQQIVRRFVPVEVLEAHLREWRSWATDQRAAAPIQRDAMHFEAAARSMAQVDAIENCIGGMEHVCKHQSVAFTCSAPSGGAIESSSAAALGGKGQS